MRAFMVFAGGALLVLNLFCAFEAMATGSAWLLVHSVLAGWTVRQLWWWWQRLWP